MSGELFAADVKFYRYDTESVGTHADPHATLVTRSVRTGRVQVDGRARFVANVVQDAATAFELEQDHFLQEPDSPDNADPSGEAGKCHDFGCTRVHERGYHSDE